ncbi:hypothetical protein KIH77_09945 [Bifidobacterium sp. 82T24]|uniref:hypothetical protein n=1 Tax=Bifidobacterium pluvialisilvae TaxID=2834436 RepID=UPI001C55C989|nr:hypothetical protein [Bifidobacterium pluvialisilvae]MBW3089033.1 hypothetical protein [Bifidobacterium pluvialisilvae]
MTASQWHRASPGVDAGYLQRLARKTGHNRKVDMITVAVFLAGWTAFVIYTVAYPAEHNPRATLLTFLAIEVGLIACAIFMWFSAGRDIGDVTLVRRNLTRLVSMGSRELDAMCAEAGVADLLRCPDYVIRDEARSAFHTTERATCLMWAPAVNVPAGYGECAGYGGADAYGVRRFSVYARRPIAGVEVGGWPIVRVTVEIYGDQARFVPDFGVSYDVWHGHGWATKRKDPSLSFGAGMIAPRYDLDFGTDRYGGNVFVR